ncbi:MAG: hypothetical protein K940chlam7_00090 [Chlamydiae bacterium]|nr:hypothetical protein [Chlamydiota bacterium]
MDISNHLKNLDGIIKCIESPRKDLDRRFILIRITSQIFAKIAIFFVRLGCRIRYGHWYNNRKVKKIVKHFIWKADQNLKSDDITRKIINISNKLGLDFDKKLSSDKSPDFQSVKELPKMNARLLFHIHGDEFGANNEDLEGYTSDVTLGYLNAFLEGRKKQDLSIYGLTDEDLQEIGDAHTLMKSKDFVKVAQSMLKKNKRVLMGGGWTGNPGHGMYYEIIPEEGDRVTFRIFNLGGGSNYHIHEIVGNKLKASPYYDLRGIKRENILNENVLRAIHELRTKLCYPDSSDKTEYNEKDIYKGLKELLEPESVMEGEIDSAKLMSFQNAGVCAWRSLMAFLATRMEKNQYKQFAVDIKLQSLVDKVRKKPKDHSIPIQEEWRLVNKSYLKLCRKITKAYEQQVIGKKYFVKAETKLRHVSNWLADNKERSLKAPSAAFPTKLTWSNVQMKENEITGTPLHQQVQEKDDRISIQPCSYLVESLEDASIETVIHECEEAYKKGEYHAVHLAILRFVERLPTNIEEESKEQAEKHMENLGKLSKIFFDSCFMVPQSDNIHPERVYVLNKLLMLQADLAEFINPLMENLQYPSRAYYQEKNFFCQLTNEHQNKEFHTFYKKISSSPKDIFCYSFYNHKSVDESSSITFGYYCNDNLLGFAECLEKIFPEIHEELSASADYVHLEKPRQNARIFTSDHVPGWFKALRDTHLSLLYLDNEPVGRPANGSNQFTFSFKHRDEKDHKDRPICKITFSLMEISGEILNQYPEQKRVRTSPESRYDRNLRPMSSWKLEKFVHWAYSQYCNNFPFRGLHSEKELLADHVSNHRIGLSDEIFKELGHLFQGGRLIIAESFEYFYRHPEKLRDPDYQALFQLLFFAENLFIKERSEKNGIKEKLSHFMSQHIEQSLAENEIQAAVFLLRMSRLFSFHTCSEALETLRRILSRNGLEPGERSVVYAEIASTLSRKKELKEKDLEDLLVSTAFLHENPVPKKWECPETNKEVRDALHIHSCKMKEALAKDPRLVNVVLKTLHEGAADKEWNVIEKEGEFPYFESQDGSEVYFPLTGQLTSKHAEVYLPLTIREHPYFKEIFDSRKKAIFRDNNIYELQDQFGNQSYCQFKEGKLTIEQKRDGEWYTFLPREVFSNDKGNSFLKSRYLQQNFHHWHSLKNPAKIEILDPKNGKKRYEAIVKDRYIQSVTETGSNNQLSLPSGFFQRFEDSSYIQEWFNGTDLAKVELPRFGLTFVPDGDKMFCQQLEGYFLSAEQYVPTLGSYSNYLVLENQQGKKKVLLPQQSLKSDEKKKESLLPLFQVDRKTATEDNVKFSTLVYDVDDNGSLLAMGREANLYLASILTAVHEYDEAAKYMKKFGVKLTPYSTGELEALLTIVNIPEITGDGSGDGLALQLDAAYIILKNRTDHNLPIGSDLECLILLTYDKYLTHYHNATALKLKKEEELFLLKHFLRQVFDVKLFIRAKELDPEYAKGYVKPEREVIKEKTETAPKFATLLSNATLPSKVKKRDLINFNHVLISRINFSLQKSPVAFYDLVKHASPQEKKWLKDAFILGKHDPDSHWSALFETILENPNEFPELPSYKVKKKWWKQILEKADELNTGKLEALYQASEARNESHNFTPEGFRLDREPAPIPEIKLDYRLEEIEPFTPTCFTEKVIVETNGHDLQEWVKEEAKNPTNSEPLYKKELERINQDLDAFREKVKRIEYELEDIGAIEKILKEGITDLKPLEIELLEIANCEPKNRFDLLNKKLRLQGRRDRVITLEDLLISFAKQEPELLIQLNPLLDEKATNTLYEKIGKYLLVATHEQQRRRALAAFEKIKGKEGEERHDLVQQLAADLLSKRHYNPREFPAYLVFEFYGNILMREMQVEKLGFFLKNGEVNSVMEMIMGSGKSKVLLPLLGLLRADGEKISMLIVPQALFESVSSDTQRVLFDAFSQSLRALHFDRNTVFTVHSLRMILDDLKNIQKNKECLIVTSKSIQCLMLKFIEQALKNRSEKELSEELRLMQEIMSLLSKSGYPIIDEADTVLNVLHEVCFSTGKKISPDSNDIAVISQIYKVLFTDPEIRALARIECDPRPIKESDVLTTKLYHDKMKRVLASKLIDSLKEATFESNTLTEKVQRFFNNFEERSEAIDYLCHIPSGQKFFDQQEPEIQNILALAGEQISNLLSHTLTRTCEEKYGLDEENFGVVAIPFAAANTPNRGSLFANHYITMNYTFQYYMKKGVSREVIVQQMERLQAEAIKELQRGGPGMTIENTKAWKLFLKLQGGLDIPLFNMKECHIEKIVSTINSNEAQIRLFVAEIILPQLDLFTLKLNCNPHNLIAFFEKVLGFTGTLWNSYSMHSKLTQKPEPGTDAKTLNILWKNSRNEVYTIKEGSPQKMIEQLEKQNIPYNVISDAGGYFKEGGNTVIAKMISKSKKLPVVFYNSQNQQAETDGTNEILLSESSTPMENRDTFLDQSHTTGSDVKQKRDAIGVVTVGRNMLLRDLLQSVWRLRGLDKSQRVKFVVSEEVKAIICQALNKKADSINFDDILCFCIINQSIQQGKDNFKALRQELISLPQALLFDVMMSENREHQLQAFELLQKEWIKSAFKTPKELFGKIAIKEDCEKVLTEEQVKCEKYLEEIFEKLPFLTGKDKIMGQVKKIVDRLKERLPAEVLVPLRDTDDDQTVEIEQEQQQETETELEVTEHQVNEKVELGCVERCPGLTKVDVLDEEGLFTGFKVEVEGPDKESTIDYKPFSPLKPYIDCTPFFPLKLYLEQDSELKEFSNFFDGIHLTINVLEWPKKDPKMVDLKLLGAHRTPFHFVRMIDDAVILLNQDDALLQERGDLINIYYDQLDDPRIAKIKFLNGESSYSKEELNFLRDWIQENGKEKILRFYCEHILAGFPEKAASYSNSNLRNLFQEVKT